MDKIKQRIEQRIDELIAGRDRFTAEANERVTVYNTVIEELRKLLAEDDSAEDDGG